MQHTRIKALEHLLRKRHPQKQKFMVWTSEDGQHFTSEGETLSQEAVKAQYGGCLLMFVTHVPERAL